MKKSELKNIIKECVKEVIFEEGVLSGIITEVANGMNLTTTQATPPYNSDMEKVALQSAEASNLMEEKRREVMDAVANNSYDDLKKKFANPEFFAGTKPLNEGTKGSPLSSVGSADAGLDITSIPGFENWGHVANKD